MKKIGGDVAHQDGLGLLGIKAINEVESASKQARALKVIAAVISQREADNKTRKLRFHPIDGDARFVIIGEERRAFWK